jgi:hypothetical protein
MAAFHYRPENSKLVTFSAWCGWKRSRGGQAGMIRDLYETAEIEHVTCKLCLRKLAAKSAPKIAKADKPARAPKLRKCDWCGGSGRFGDKGRFDGVGSFVGAGDSCDFCHFCRGAGTVMR